MQGAVCLWLHLYGRHLQPSKAALHSPDRQLPHMWLSHSSQGVWLTASHLQIMQGPSKLWVNNLPPGICQYMAPAWYGSQKEHRLASC